MRSIHAVMPALALAVGAGCGAEPEEHVATFGPVSNHCLSWERIYALLCEDVIADDGEFNTLQWIEGLAPSFGETVTVRYLQHPIDTSGQTDTPSHTFELIAVESRVGDAIGTQYPVRAYHLTPRAGDPDGTLFMADDRATDELDRDVGVVLGCADETVCAPIGIDDAVAHLTLELTDDPIVPLQIIARE